MHFISSVSPMKWVDALLRTSTLLHSHPAYVEADFISWSVFRTGSTFEVLPVGKFMENYWYLVVLTYCMAQELLLSFSLRNSQFTLSSWKQAWLFCLSDQHRPVFSEALWNMLLHFIHTSRNKGRWILMWCSDRAYALNSSYFLNQKIAGFFWLYKGKSIGDGLTRRQPVREAKTDKKENALSDFSLNLQ